jgi:hypothetical protein
MSFAVNAGGPPPSGAIAIDSENFFYSENFSSLPSTGTTLSWTNNDTIPGWYRDYEGTAPPARDVSVQSTGANNSGVVSQDGFINVGVEEGTAGQTDFSRTLVMRRAFTFYGAIGVAFQNTTGSPVSSFNLGYTGEQWRRNGDGLPSSLYFEYTILTSLSGLDIDSDPASWTRVPALEFESPSYIGGNTGTNGNLPEYRTVIAPVSVDVTLPDGSFLVVRWYQDRTGSDGLATTARHALGIDEMSLSIGSGGTPPEVNAELSLVDILGNPGNDYVALTWQQPMGGSGTTGVDYTAGGFTYVMEHDTDLTAPWSTGNITVISVQDDTPVAGTQTVTARLNTPIASDGKQFLRLNVF